MNKHDFLMALSEKLQGIPREDAAASLDYYAEIIDDRMEEGLSEEEAVAAIGSVEDIAGTILGDIPPVRPVPQTATPRRKFTWWEILLLVLGSPVWLSLVIAAGAVLLSVYISLWVVVISLYAAAVSVGVSVIVCILAGILVRSSLGALLIALGAVLVCAGLTILLFMLSNLSARGMIILTKLSWKAIKRSIVGKEQSA